jgi:hypothetical protein
VSLGRIYDKYEKIYFTKHKVKNRAYFEPFDDAIDDIVAKEKKIQSEVCNTTMSPINRKAGRYVDGPLKLSDYVPVSDSVTSRVIRAGQTTELESIGNDIVGRIKYALGLKQDVSNEEYKAALDRYMKKVLF